MADNQAVERLAKAVEENNRQLNQVHNELSSTTTALKYHQKTLDSHDASIRDLYQRQNQADVNNAQIKPKTEANTRLIGIVWGVVVLILSQVLTYARSKLGV